mgnify:CR=1 FL=1
MIYNGDNFSFEIFRYKNIVFGSFIQLHNNDLRGRNNIFKDESKTMVKSVTSSSMPELSSTQVYLPGDSKYLDTVLISKRLQDEEQAKLYYNELIDMLIQADNKIQ